MEFALSLKALWDRRRYVLPGLVVVFLLSLLIVFSVSLAPPSLKSRRHRVWIATAQVLTDSKQSAVGNLREGFGPLVPLATLYANLMTSPTLVQLIGQAAHIPASEIAVSGPIGTNGQRPEHRAMTAAPKGAEYTLLLDTDIAQPFIRITAQAPTSRAARDLSNGAADGLISYVTQFEVAQPVPDRYRVDIRKLGPAIEVPSDSGTKPILFIPIWLALSVAWCLLVLFVSRIRRTWRLVPHEMPPDPLSELDTGAVFGSWPETAQGAANGDGEFEPALAAEAADEPKQASRPR